MRIPSPSNAGLLEQPHVIVMKTPPEKMPKLLSWEISQLIGINNMHPIKGTFCNGSAKIVRQLDIGSVAKPIVHTLRLYFHCAVTLGSVNEN